MILSEFTIRKRKRQVTLRAWSSSVRPRSYDSIQLSLHQTPSAATNHASATPMTENQTISQVSSMFLS
ncbi:hypothetical protein M758_8G173100 [Ceratodon purpureus]|nr:hypothetical protein M758_8G173100 [Ceratodon purpureus]